jgi:hypothetical protein
VPSDLRYSLINTFSAIDQFRANILFNLQGAAQPGFNKKNTQLALNSAPVTIRHAEAGGPNTGGKVAIAAGPSELRMGQTSLDFAQGTIGQRVGQLTALAINGEGFFVVAESLQAGARVFLTRDGSFVWRDTTPADKKKDKFKQFHLSSRSGLFVLRAQDVDLDPSSPNFMRLRVSALDTPPGLMTNSDFDRDATRLLPAGASAKTGDWVPDRLRGVIGFEGDPFKMTDEAKKNELNNNSDIALVRVPLRQFLKESSFGATVYETNISTRAGIVGKSYRAWRAADDGVQIQSESAETPDFTAIQTEANIQSDVANFVFKNLRDMLDNYNRSIDDLLGLIR